MAARSTRREKREMRQSGLCTSSMKVRPANASSTRYPIHVLGAVALPGGAVAPVTTTPAMAQFTLTVLLATRNVW